MHQLSAALDPDLPPGAPWIYEGPWRPVWELVREQLMERAMRQRFRHSASQQLLWAISGKLEGILKRHERGWLSYSKLHEMTGLTLQEVKRGLAELRAEGFLVSFRDSAERRAELPAEIQRGLLDHPPCGRWHCQLHPSLFPDFKGCGQPAGAGMASGQVAFSVPAKGTYMTPSAPARIGVDVDGKSYVARRPVDNPPQQRQTAAGKELADRLQRFWGPDGLLGPAEALPEWRARRLADWARRGIKPIRPDTILEMLLVDANREAQRREDQEHEIRKRQERAGLGAEDPEIEELVEAGPGPPE